VLLNGDPNPNRPDLPPYGGGETACKPLMAAVANAIHDATGVRLRRVPFRDARVLAERAFKPRQNVNLVRRVHRLERVKSLNTGQSV
jgi:hypothetical protein